MTITSDRLLVRIVGVTVCSLALLAVLVQCLGALWGRDIPDSLTQLAYLLAGGLLGALTTRLTGDRPQEVTTAPGDVLAVEPTRFEVGRTPIDPL